jgi:hypothetical protein
MAKRYNVLTRCLAALALFFVYFVSASAVLVGATTSPAQAYRGRGFYGGRGYYGRGYGRGWGRGRGYGFYGGPVVVAPGPRCWWNVYGVRVCRW